MRIPQWILLANENPCDKNPCGSVLEHITSQLRMPEYHAFYGIRSLVCSIIRSVTNIVVILVQILSNHMHEQ